MRKFFIPVIVAILLVLTACALRREKAQVSSSGKEFESCMSQGSLSLTEGKPDEAIIQLKEAVVLNPDSPKAHNLLGIAYFQKKDYRLAAKEYEKATNLNPSYAQAYNNLGSAYFMSGEISSAEDMFKKAISLSPGLVSSYYGLGTLLATQGRVEECSHYFSKAIELDPDFLERNPAFVATFTSGALRNPEVLFTYAKIYAAASNVEKAVLYLQRAEQAGFKDWYRIAKEKEFEKVREDERIKGFIR
jgi:tetratricopeptide (TPR) repeat protein